MRRMMGLFKRRTKNTKGFTLIELIVVIAILAVLAAIAVPSLYGTLKNSKIKADMAMAAQIGRCAEIYAAEINNADVGSITMTASTDAFVRDYLNGIVPKLQQKATGTFTCSVTTGKATVTAVGTATKTYYNAGVPVVFTDAATNGTE
jgi:type IV pilus assembly protein PilA